MTPLAIIIMIECYASINPGVNIIPHIWNSPSAKASRATLLEFGLIDADNLATDKGNEYVKRLMAVPVEEEA